MSPQQSQTTGLQGAAEVAATAEPHASTEPLNEGRRPAEDIDVSQAEIRPVTRQHVDRADARRSPVFAENDAEQFQRRWSDIQARFVDQPRRAVEQADGLVGDMMQRLAQAFADEKSRLERQIDRGRETNTEELRQSLQRYRSFFDRLLTM